MNELIRPNSLDPKRNLESDLRCETSGYFGKMVLQMLKSKESDPSEEKIRRGLEAIVNEDEISNVVKQITDALEKWFVVFNLTS